MKKKVYEKQLNQERPDLTSNLKKETKAKTKCKKSKTSRQESHPVRPKTITSRKASASNDHVDGDTNNRLSYPQPKVGMLPKVDVLIKRRAVEPQLSSLIPTTALEEPTFPSPSVSNLSRSRYVATKGTGGQTTSIAVHENVTVSGNSEPSSDFVRTSAVGVAQDEAKNEESRPEPNVVPASSSYRIDLNKGVGGVNDNVIVEHIHQSNISCNMPSDVSVFVATRKSGDFATSNTDNSHVFPSDSIQTVSHAYAIPGASQPVSVTSLTTAGTNSLQPVSLVSSPHIVAASAQYTGEDTSPFSTQSGDYGVPQYQTDSMSNELHTLTPMVLPENRRFDNTTAAPRVVNYGDLHPVSTVASWEQENNRYSEYPMPWRNHSNENIYLNNGMTQALKMPFVNGNSNNIGSSEFENNNDTSLLSHNSRGKLYPHVPQHHDITEDDKKDSENYVNGYTSDDSSSAKVPVGGSSRRRRKRVQTPVQRSAANMRERRRMCHLNDAFNYLKEHLPNVKDKKKLSRIQTLKAAIYYIHLLRDSLELQ